MSIKKKKYVGAIFLVRLARPYLGYILLLLIVAVTATIMDALSVGMLVPLLTGLMDTSLPTSEIKALQFFFQWIQIFDGIQKIYIAFIFLVCAVLLKNIFVAISLGLSYWLSSRLLADLQIKTTNLLMHIGLEFHFSKRSGDLINKSLDCTGEIEFLLRYSFNLLVNIFTLAMLIFLLGILSWQLTAIAILFGYLSSFLLQFYNRSLKRQGLSQQESSRNLKSLMFESLAGISLIKAASKESDQAAQLHKQIDQHRHHLYRLNFKINSVNPIFDSIGVIGMVLICIIAMWIFRDTPGQTLTILLPFIYILLRVVPLLRLMQWQRAEILGRWSYIETVMYLLNVDDKPILSDGLKEFSHFKDGIKFNSVSFSYYSNDKVALNNVSFKIPHGQTTAIIGHSGSGKSTIAMLLLRLSDPQCGDILIDDVSLREFQLDSFHQKIGFVSQDTFLFHDTVRFNIGFTTKSELNDTQIIAIAKQAGAHDFIMAMPDQYETVIGDRGVRLSGGQRQRLAIARAIAMDPEILLLDEATSALDVATEKHIHETIVKLSHNRTVVIIAHRLSTIQNADNIIVLRDGEVAEVGSISELNNQSSEYSRLISLQL